MPDEMEDDENDVPEEKPGQLHVRATENDPDRCDGTTGQGPCPYKKIPGANYCAQHGGASQIARTKLAEKRKYLGMQWANQIAEFANDPDIKRLNQEIGILRLILDKLLESCKTDTDLLLRSSSIGELVDKVGKLVVNCNMLDMKLGVMLDKEQLAEFGRFVVVLVSDYITDENKLTEFIHRLTTKIKDVGTQTDRAKEVLGRLSA